MKTKVIKLHTLETREDLKYMKYCKAEELSYELRQVPLEYDVEKELECLRNQAISQSVDGKIISISSKIIPTHQIFLH